MSRMAYVIPKCIDHIPPFSFPSPGPTGARRAPTSTAFIDHVHRVVRTTLTLPASFSQYDGMEGFTAQGPGPEYF